MLRIRELGTRPDGFSWAYDAANDCQVACVNGREVFRVCVAQMVQASEFVIDWNDPAAHKAIATLASIDEALVRPTMRRLGDAMVADLHQYLITGEVAAERQVREIT